MPVFRLISAVFLSSCQGIIEKCKKEEEEGKSKEKTQQRDQVQVTE